MKIRKLNESILKEAEEEKATAVQVNPKADSASTIADNIVSTAKDAGIAVSPEAAKAKATEIKSIADLINADKLAIIGTYVGDNDADIEHNLIIKNKLTDVLDIALEENKEYQDEHAYMMTNVLVEGLPGSSKTAVIKNWAHVNGINLVALNAKDREVDQIINGIAVPVRSETGDVKNIVKFRSKALNDLDKPNSVLFLDELNRQQSEALRGSLLDILNDKSIKVTNEDGTEGTHVFKNMLFAIVAMNPSAQNDLGATNLNAAELGRMSYYVDFESTVDSAKSYFNAFLVPTIKRSAEFMLKLEPYKDQGEDFKKYYDKARNMLLKCCYRKRLADRILKSKTFRFSTIADVERLSDYEVSKDDMGRAIVDGRGQKTSYSRRFAYVSQRELTKLILSYNGDIENFKKRVELRNFAPEDKLMLLNTISDYTELSEEETIKQALHRYNITAGSSAVKNVSKSKPTGDVDSKIFGTKKSTVDVTARTNKIKSWLGKK